MGILDYALLGESSSFAGERDPHCGLPGWVNDGHGRPGTRRRVMVEDGKLTIHSVSALCISYYASGEFRQLLKRCIVVLTLFTISFCFAVRVPSTRFVFSMARPQAGHHGPEGTRNFRMGS
jgi:hypothetical protein